MIANTTEGSGDNYSSLQSSQEMLCLKANNSYRFPFIDSAAAAAAAVEVASVISSVDANVGHYPVCWEPPPPLIIIIDRPPLVPTHFSSPRSIVLLEIEDENFFAIVRKANM